MVKMTTPLPVDHPWAAYVRSRVVATGDYEDFGQWAGLAWRLWGDPADAAVAVPQLVARTQKMTASANDVRENAWELAWWYGQLRPLMTTQQEADYRTALLAVADWVCNTYGFRLADTDQTVGQYFFLALLDQYAGTAFLSGTAKNAQTGKTVPLGGLDATAADWATVRNAVAQSVAWAEGGEWVESGEYDLGTPVLLLLGAWAAGVEHFPEVTVWAAQCARWQQVNVTPDLTGGVPWGDTQDANGLVMAHRPVLLSVLCGLTGDAGCLNQLRSLLAGKAVNSWAVIGSRAMYVFDPRALDVVAPPVPPVSPPPVPPVPPPTPVPLTRLFVSAGGGHFRYRHDSALCCVHLPRRRGIDHEVAYFGDIRLWLDGEWVLGGPLGYAGAMVEGESKNAALLAGLSSLFDRGPVDWQEFADGFQVSGTTSGPYYGPPYYQPPPEFASWTRTVRYTPPGRIEVRDVFAGTPPTRPDRYRKADADRITGALALWQVVWQTPVAPTVDGNVVQWTTPKGRTVMLTVSGHSGVKVVKASDVLPDGGYVQPAELTGYQIRFLSDEPTCEMVAVVGVN